MTAKHTKGQRSYQFEKEIKKVVLLKYQLFLPKGYEENKRKRWPLMLFLHGAGERGSDIKLVKKHGPPKLVTRQKDFPFVLISPQCPEGGWWKPDEVMALVDEIVVTHHIDKDRIYVTGLSMGGYGTWALAGEYPDRFAAIAPICGGGSRQHARRIAQQKLPTWVFHGALDQAVPIEESQRLVDMMKRFDGDVRFTVYPNAQHDSWTETYKNPELYAWFLKHRRKK
jgi:predicted peptidase